jgi:hypothetical protein
MYTGVDQEPNGVFGNEIKDDDTQEKIREQDRVIAEITPKIQGIVDIIDNETQRVNSISELGDLTVVAPEELKVRMLAVKEYVSYLGDLKTKFVIALSEAKKK